MPIEGYFGANDGDTLYDATSRKVGDAFVAYRGARRRAAAGRRHVMMRSDILAKVGMVAAETFGCTPGQIRETTVAADIEKWDSLRHLIFISGIEQEFGIEFDMATIAELTNVGELVSRIEMLTA